MFILFLIIVGAFFIGSVYFIITFLVRYRKKQLKARQLRIGDVVMLLPKYKSKYPHLPSNNPFTVVGFNKSQLEVRYIHFKKVTMHHETVEREAVKKVS